MHINRRSIEDNRFVGAILNGDIDFYLSGLNQIEDLDTSRLHFASLYEDDMVLLVHEKHPFAGRKTIDLWKCQEESFINLADETNLQQFNNHLFRQTGFKPKVVMACDYTLRDQMAAAGHGVSVTTLLGTQSSKVSGVVAIPITYSAEKRKSGVIWRKNRVFSGSMEKFFQTAKDFCSNT